MTLVFARRAWCPLLVVGCLTVAPMPASAGFVVAGFNLASYASVDDPTSLTFDAGGVLFTGRDNSGSGGGFGDAVRIHVVAAGGGVGVEFGTSTITDPDTVTIDLLGSITGIPGSVLVGGGTGTGSTRLSSVSPGGTVSEVFTTTLLSDINAMAVDSTGRLLLGDDTGIHVTTGGPPTGLVGLGGPRAASLAVDSLDRIFVATTDDAIRIYNSDGTLHDGAFYSGSGVLSLAFGNGGAFGHDLYAINTVSGELLRFTSLGLPTVLGTGFNGDHLAFGPDHNLYIAEFDNDRILRVSAVPEPISIAMWLPAGLITCVAGLHRRGRKRSGCP